MFLSEKELRRIYYINKEITRLQKDLGELRCTLGAKGQEITGMPFVGGTSDKTGSTAVKMQEVTELIEIKLKELYIERARVERYINTIEDSELRIILRLRCIHNMTWSKIERELPMSERTAKRKYYNHFKQLSHTV